MTTALRFSEKIVIVTGAGQGIGRVVALRAAHEGARVVLVDRADTVRDVADEIAAHGGRAQAVIADLETYAGACAMTRCALDSFGRIDVLINNVGGTIWAKPFEAYEEAQIEAEVRRSLFPTLWCCRAVLPAMLERGYGRIVNIASTAGQTGYPYVAAYCAAKHGVIGLTRSLAREVATKGVTVNAVCPGYTETELLQASLDQITRKTARSEQDARAALLRQNPQHRFIAPPEVAHAVLWLCAPGAESMTGQSISVSGGEVT